MKKFKNKKLASALLAATALLGGNSAPKTLANDQNNMITQNLKVENTKSKYTTAQWVTCGILGVLVTASGIGYYIYNSKKQVKENQNILPNSNSNFEGSKKSYENLRELTSSYEEKKPYEYEWKLYKYDEKYAYEEFENFFGDVIKEAKNNNENVLNAMVEYEEKVNLSKNREIVYEKFIGKLKNQIGNDKEREKFIEDIKKIFKNKWENIVPHVKKVKIHGSEFAGTKDTRDRYDEFKNAEEAKQKLEINGLYSQAAKSCYQEFYSYINKIAVNDNFELNFENNNTLVIKKFYADSKITLDYKNKQLKLLTGIKRGKTEYEDQDFVIIDVSSVNFNN